MSRPHQDVPPALAEIESTLPPRRQWPKMHPHIMFHLFKRISTSDAICFALTCKFTLAYYYLGLKKAARGTMPVTPRRMFLGVEIFPWFRIDLLRRLQNTRWKFCDLCWILHPRSVWQPFWRLDHKMCSYGCHTLGNRKCYLPYAGEVDMCSCSRLNIHHKLQIFSLYHQPSNSKGGIQHLTNGSCECIEMLHACTFKGNPIAQVHINVSFSFGCQDKSLRMRTRLLFNFSRSSPAQVEDFWNKRRHICVRENTGKWVKRFFLEGWNYFAGELDWKPSEWFSWDVNDQGPLEITLNRNLGKREWPSKGWIRNCRKNFK